MLYPCFLKLLVLLLASSAAIRMLRHYCLFFWGFWVCFFFFPGFLATRISLRRWFYWVSHTFKPILLLQDTNFCVFCQHTSWVTNPIKNHKSWGALVLPTSVYFKMLPLPLPLPGLLPPGSSAGVGMQGKQLASRQLSVVPNFLKPSHHGGLFPAAGLKRRWQNIAQLGVKPVLWAAVTPVGVWSLQVSARAQILFVFVHLYLISF